MNNRVLAAHPPLILVCIIPRSMLLHCGQSVGTWWGDGVGKHGLCR
jgi:hypothetical protein